MAEFQASEAQERQGCRGLISYDGMAEKFCSLGQVDVVFLLFIRADGELCQCRLCECQNRALSEVRAIICS